MTRFDDLPGELSAAQQLEELFVAHRKAVARYVRRRTPAESVDDVVAETFLIAWRRLERVPADSPLPWLLAVAHNLIAHQQRGAGRRLALSLRLRDNATTQEWAPASIQEPSGPVAGAVACLGEKDREALELAVLDGLKPQDAATVLGILPSTFRARLHRAKRRLRHLLEEQTEQRLAEPSPHPFKAKETRT